MTMLRDSVQQAKKCYPCDASRLFLQSNYGEMDVSADDWLSVQGAESDKWKIRAGQDYRKVVYSDGNKLVIYRARLGMDAICNRYQMFDEF